MRAAAACAEPGGGGTLRTLVATAAGVLERMAANSACSSPADFGRASGLMLSARR